MSVKSAPYYWVECDNCGARCEYGDFSAWADKSYAIDSAVDGDWYADGDKHHCPDCPSLRAECHGCGEPARDDAGKRDGMCQSCWNATGAVTT